MRVFTLENSGGGGGGGGIYRRAYKGSEEFSSSGTWLKSTAANLPFLAGLPAAAIECEIDVCGGGGAGEFLSSGTGASRGGYGSRPERWLVAFADLPESVEYMVSAGAPSGTANSVRGGTTTFGPLVRSHGGQTGRFAPDFSLGNDVLTLMPDTAGHGGSRSAGSVIYADGTAFLSVTA